MIPKALDSIQTLDIEALITDQRPEDRTIEYKSALPGQSDTERIEFLADVSAFANAGGGDLLYGITEKLDTNGKTTRYPESAPGLPGVNPNQVILRFEDMIRTGLAPRLLGVTIREVAGTDGPVLILRIPRSWTAPHMITFGGRTRFYSRNSAGKYPLLDVGEIRMAFEASGMTVERMTRFRDDRLKRIYDDRTNNAATFVLHVLPLAAFEPGHVVDIRDFMSKPNSDLDPLNSYGTGRFNFDGRVVVAPESKGYVQIFRSGVIEAVARGGFAEVFSVDGRPAAPWIRAEFMAKRLPERLGEYLEAEKKLGVAPPFYVSVAMQWVNGYRIYSRYQDYSDSVPIDRAAFAVPEVVIDDFGVDPEIALRPIMDAIWQAGGYSHCLLYDDETGKLKPLQT